MTSYTGDPTYDTVLTLAYGLVVFVFVGAAFMKSPYGRFASDRWGVNLNPRGGLFRFVTNPSYLTEISAFTGFAIATWSLGATFILLITIANLVPRAFQTHRWYREKFPDYPSERRVLIPFLL